VDVEKAVDLIYTVVIEGELKTE